MVDSVFQANNFSGWCEVSRVADMDTQLIRKIIRMIAFKAALDQDGQAQLRSVLSSRSLNFVTKLEVGLLQTCNR